MKFLYKTSIKIFSSLNIGIIGYPNVGKSLFYNTLSRRECALSENYPFSTIDPNISMIKIEDKGLMNLTKIIKPKKVCPFEIKLIDIAGIIKDTHINSKSLEPAYLCDGFIQIVRCFQDKSIHYIGNNNTEKYSLNPYNEVDILNTEIFLNDILLLSKRKEKLKGKEIKNDKISGFLNFVYELLNSYKQEEGMSIKTKINNEVNKYKEDKDFMNFYHSLNLLITKPVIYLLNTDFPIVDYNIINDFINKMKLTCEEYSITSIKYEREAVYLAEEANSIEEFYDNIIEFYKLESNDNTLNESILPDYDNSKILSNFRSISTIEKIIKRLNFLKFYTFYGDSNTLSSFLIPYNTEIQDAAGKIHSDFKKNFICADIISSSEYIKYINNKKTKDNFNEISDIELKKNGLMKKVNKGYRIKDDNLIIKVNI